jgi:hypothetical protein
MNLFYKDKQGIKGRCPFPLQPQIPAEAPPLRRGQFRLTKPNTFGTIRRPASLRSDCCSPSLWNAVRVPSGISVHLHRNTHYTLVQQVVEVRSTPTTIEIFHQGNRVASHLRRPGRGQNEPLPHSSGSNAEQQDARIQ